MTTISVEIVGAGVVGLSCAWALLNRGCEVKIITKDFGRGTCSWSAGGMIAPDCEMDNAEPIIARLGHESKLFWRDFAAINNGTLAIATRRDLADLQRFATVTQNWQRLERQQITELEPDLDFAHGLFFAAEQHINPRSALLNIERWLQARNVKIETGKKITDNHIMSPLPNNKWRLDCRGMGSKDVISDLRGVRGEMIIVKTRDINLQRSIRLLHPRMPFYVVPHGDNKFMIGATMIESSDSRQVSARSAVDLLNAAYTINPAFAEAEIIEMAADIRPALPDNRPSARVFGRTICVNGAYRHGFLIAPALANKVADYIVNDKVDKNVINWRLQ